MALDHLVVHKITDYLCAFPDIIRLHNGDLVTAFRESAIYPPNPSPKRPQDAKITHHHVAPGSRVALVRSTDDGCTWGPGKPHRSRPWQRLARPQHAFDLAAEVRRADRRQPPVVCEPDGGTDGSAAGKAEHPF